MMDIGIMCMEAVRTESKQKKIYFLMNECDGAVILDKLIFVQLVKTIIHI